MNHRLAAMRDQDPEDRGRRKRVSEACFLEDGLAVPRESALLSQRLQLVSDREGKEIRVQGYLPFWADLKKN